MRGAQQTFGIALLAIAGIIGALRLNTMKAHADRRLERIELVELEQKDLLDDHAILMRECESLRVDLGDALEGCTAALGDCDRLLRDSKEPR